MGLLGCRAWSIQIDNWAVVSGAPSSGQRDCAPAPEQACRATSTGALSICFLQRPFMAGGFDAHANARGRSQAFSEFNQDGAEIWILQIERVMTGAADQRIRH